MLGDELQQEISHAKDLVVVVKGKQQMVDLVLIEDHLEVLALLRQVAELRVYLPQLLFERTVISSFKLTPKVHLHELVCKLDGVYHAVDKLIANAF